MSDNQQIRDKLIKIKALFAGASSEGERQAAQAAMDRLKGRIDSGGAGGPVADARVEYRFSFNNSWSKRLFFALCRSKGYSPYRYARMRRTSSCVRISEHELNRNLWPEYVEMNKVLVEYLGEVAEQIIADCINRDRSDAEVCEGLPSPNVSTTEG